MDNCKYTYVLAMVKSLTARVNSPKSTVLPPLLRRTREKRTVDDSWAGLEMRQICVTPQKI
jgi:hypothetical protein